MTANPEPGTKPNRISGPTPKTVSHPFRFECCILCMPWNVVVSIPPNPPPSDAKPDMPGHENANLTSQTFIF